MAGTGAGRQAGPRRAVVGVRCREHRHVEVMGQAPQFVLPGHRPPRCAPAAAGGTAGRASAATRRSPQARAGRESASA